MSLIRLEVENLTIQNPTNVAQLVSIKSVAKSGLLSQTGHEAVAKIVKRSQNPRARLFWIATGIEFTTISVALIPRYLNLCSKHLDLRRFFHKFQFETRILQHIEIQGQELIWNAVNLHWKFTRSRKSESEIEYLKKKNGNTLHHKVQKKVKLNS